MKTGNNINFSVAKSGKYKIFAAVILLLCFQASLLPAQQNKNLITDDRTHGRLDDADFRKQRVQSLYLKQEWRRSRAQKQAQLKGLAENRISNEEQTFQLVDWRDVGPLYYTTFNANAAISSGANLLQNSPWNLDGATGIIGVWDAGKVRSTHQEFGGRVVINDNVALHSHSTHVAGTLIASGVDASARGMAIAATLYSYDWNDDMAELAAVGAASSIDSNKISISNHSYGMACGWVYDSNKSPPWTYYGNGSGTNACDYDFGRYNDYSREIDEIAFDAPYLTMFWAAGNDRSDNPNNGSLVKLLPGGATVTYNSSIHPPGDGQYKNGYDLISFSALGKNVVTVGAVTDAVNAGLRAINKATMTSFSCWGPADDGRIKPDIVANGNSLKSCGSDSDTSYTTMSGTSMAAPNAAGTAHLLTTLYAGNFNGYHMRSATLKGLLIHTADDLGRPGPDYTYGWGLINGVAAANLIMKAATNTTVLSLREATINTEVPLKKYDFAWDSMSPIRVTLCWTDPAGEEISGHDSRQSALVNDLDLKVIAPDGSQYFPFVMPYVGDWSNSSLTANATHGTNHTDNVEQVLIDTPSKHGVYQAVVTYSGTLVNDLQPFSLLVSGSAPIPATILIVR